MPKIREVITIYANHNALSGKRYRITDITNPDAPVQVDVEAMLVEVKMADGRLGWVPLLTSPDRNNRTETTVGLAVQGWLG